MLKFIWGKGHQPTAERLKVQKELFTFHKAVKHGFPTKPSALAWDPELKLLAVATKQGAIRVYGQPGVEFYGQHSSEKPVSILRFIPGQGRLVSLTDDNVLHLWEINGNEIEEKKSTALEGRLKKVSVLCLEPENKRILVGTEGGNIYLLNLWNFQIDESIIYQDIVMQNSPEDFKVNPGAVEALLSHPTEPNQILIGYTRGLVVLWDRVNVSAVQTYVASQQLESLAWRNDGSQFVSAHNDGSYVIWSTNTSDPLDGPTTPYGPYPCKAISKVKWAHDNGNSWMLFSGGMPRASYGDKFTVTLMQGEDKHVVLDLTSKVIDFEVISDGLAPTTLVILAEEELVAVDMTNDSWPVHRAPYLNAIHASAITCLTHVPDVTRTVFDKLTEAGKQIDKGSKPYSEATWPVIGGTTSEESKETLEVLVTGHEDGSVKFWSCRSIAMAPIVTIKTNKFFVGDELDEPCEDQEEEEEEWPPFRKVGLFDPYSDDPRLAVKKLVFCGQSGRLMIGGTAGQVVVCDLVDQAVEKALKVIKTDLVTEKEGFTWKGHNALATRDVELKLPSGFQPAFIVQITPPASINSLGIQSDWGVIAAGTAHGLVVLDSVQSMVIASKCTLSAHDIANADDNPMSRRKSLKKSLRESFRRLRKGRSQRHPDKKKDTGDPIKKELPRADSPEARPVERAIEARTGAEDGSGSMVRCLHFAQTFIANPQTLSHTLWAGTNSGQILIFLLSFATGDKRKTDKVSCLLGKEIQLKHKAPVIAIQTLDAGGIPLPEGSTANESTPSPHRVLITSEEQFKTFTLPTLKPCGKYKLTAHEGARIRRVGFVTFTSSADNSYSENCFTCLTNQGDVGIYSLPELRRQVHTNCMKKEDVIGISTLAFSPKGDAFYLCSSSEIQRVSLAANRVVVPKGTLTLSPEARPDQTPEEAPSTVAVTTPAAETDSQVEKQNKENERQTQAVGAAGDVTTPSDPHNDTTVSEISADITLDSVKDHTLAAQAQSLTIVEERTSASLERTTTEVVTTTTKSSSLSSSQVIQQSTTIQNGETTSTQQQVNGLLDSLESTTYFRPPHIQQILEAEAPLASIETIGSEFNSIAYQEETSETRLT